MRKNLKISLTSVFIFLIFQGISWNKLSVKESYNIYEDRVFYHEMAKGNYSASMTPFSKRILHPIIAATFSKIASISLIDSFLLLSIIFLFIFILLSSTWLHKISHIPLAVIPFILVTPLLHIIFFDILMHDLFYFTVLILLLLAMFNQFYLLVVILTFILFLTRDSTILLSVLILAIWLKEKKYRWSVLLLASSVVAIFVVGHFVDLGNPNRHDLPDLLYTLYKIPFYISSNFFGVNLKANTFDFACAQIALISMPSWIPSGSISEVAVCDFNPLFPLRTFTNFFSDFGLAPLVILVWLKRVGMSGIKNLPSWSKFCLLYGLLVCAVSLVVAPTYIYRLMGHGWPAFWLAAPYILVKHFDHSKTRRTAGLIVLHSTLMWVPYIYYSTSTPMPFGQGILLCSSLLIWVLGYRILSRLKLIQPSQSN